jgi:hypothetical protein
MGDDRAIDKTIVDLFFDSGIHLMYAQKYLSPTQIDL